MATTFGCLGVVVVRLQGAAPVLTPTGTTAALVCSELLVSIKQQLVLYVQHQLIATTAVVHSYFGAECLSWVLQQRVWCGLMLGGGFLHEGPTQQHV